MQIIDALHLTATAGYCTLLWTVQILVYPQMAQVPQSTFSSYHERHCSRILWVVAPLFLFEGVMAVTVAWLSFTATPMLQSLSLGLFIAGNALTFTVFAPLHFQLSRTRNERLLQKLMHLNWVRTGLESLRLVVVVLISVQ